MRNAFKPFKFLAAISIMWLAIAPTVHAATINLTVVTSQQTFSFPNLQVQAWHEQP